MKAAVFHGAGEGLRIEDVPTPAARAGEIVLKVAYCGICGTDVHATEASAFTLPAGTVLGHEFSGTVVESQSPDWRVGDLAIGIPLLECDACKPLGECRKGLGICCDKNRIVGLAATAPGAYAEYVRLGARHALRVPASVDLKLAALVEPLAVGAHAVRLAGPVAGRRVLVVGAGPIGLSVTCSAVACGAAHVTVIERSAARRAHAARLGAHVVLTGEEDWKTATAGAGGAPPDVIFECTAVPGMIQRCIDMLAVQGMIAVVGVNVHQDIIYPRLAMNKEVRVVFPRGYTPADFESALAIVSAGKVDLGGLVTRVVPLDELPQTFEELRAPTEQVKVLVSL